MSWPAGFLWGAATSAYQIEGAVREDGRGPSIWDTFSHTPGRIADGATGDVAADHYHRLEQDVALMRELGLGAYRFSVAWPRILPAGDGEVERRGLDFYRRLVALLSEAGIEPVVTLYHWDLPQALQDRGGWANRATVDAFVRYAEVVHDALGDGVEVWLTVNEPWCAAFLGHSSGVHAPGLTDPRTAYRAAHHLLLAHGDATVAMRRAAGAAHRFGFVPNLYGVVARSEAPEDVAAAELVDALQNRMWLDAVLRGRYPDEVVDLFARFGADDALEPGDAERIAAPVDVLGVNYYSQHHVAAGPGRGPVGSEFPGCESVQLLDPPEPTTAMGWSVEPDGLERLLVRLRDEYDAPPVLICENGAAYPDEVGPDGEVADPERVRYLEEHVAAVARALRRGVDVRGYFVWSLIDNFEWSFGYTRRFGIVHVDFATQRRRIKASGQWYRRFVAAV